MSHTASTPARSRLPSLTSLRAFAAIAVVLHHTRHKWVHTPATDLVREVGWMGVGFFFILSGFVLMRTFDSDDGYRSFVTRRLARIYPLHLATLLVSLGSYFTVRSALAGNIGDVPGTLANFVLLHGVVPGHPNIRQAWNGVSWTLSCELCFYLMAPWMFRRMLASAAPVQVFYRVSAALVLLFALAVTASYKGWTATADFLEYHPLPRTFEFLLGACGALLLRNGFRFHSRSLSLALIILPIVLCASLFPDNVGMRHPVVLQYLFVPGAFLLIVSAAAVDSRGLPSQLRHPVLVLLGDASFAVYMIHALLLGAFLRGVGKQPLAALREHPIYGELLTAAFVLVSFVLAIAIYRYFETPLRLWLSRDTRRARNAESLPPVETPSSAQ